MNSNETQKERQIRKTLTEARNKRKRLIAKVNRELIKLQQMLVMEFDDIINLMIRLKNNSSEEIEFREVLINIQKRIEILKDGYEIYKNGAETIKLFSV